MFADNTLTPREAVRLCALGTVNDGAMRYSELARAVRHFCGRVMGPSLDLMGLSIELLLYEGLVTAVDGKGMEDDALLEISPAGAVELKKLMTAPLRASADLTKLVMALKFRFLHILAPAEQAVQIDMLAELSETELGRLEDLRETACEGSLPLQAWLDHDIAQLKDRLAWLHRFRDSLQ